MIVQKRWGLGTIFSLIVVYFIYLYSKQQGWSLLAFISKWYLIIIGGLIALSLGIIILVILFTLFIFLISMLKLHSFNRKAKKQKARDYVDVDYKIKE
ncbi:hypothetical protein J4204_04980 [Candidatus Woesearchaeota archaeon]|nr:hypothetical protein [Candidatus Woesearchaeota archaeon]